MRKKWFKRIGVGAVVAGMIYSSLVITPFGHRSVIWSVGGVSYEERQPGLSFVVPFVQRYHPVDVREQRYVTIDIDGKANAFVQSKDLQEITVRASLVYRVDPTQAAELYDDVGPDFETSIIEPIFFDAVKEAGGQRVALSFAEELASIADDIDSIVTPQLAQRGIQVMSVALEDAVFDPNFIQSVKDKVIADQEAEEQRKLVEAERAKKQQVELQAEAEEARATSLGLTPAQYLNWLYLQKWDGQLPATLVGQPDGLDLLLGID
jgi:prohibitin 2